MSTRSASSRSLVRAGALLLPALLLGFNPPILASRELPSPGSLVRVFMVREAPVRVGEEVVRGTQVKELGVTPGVVIDARGLVSTWVPEVSALLVDDSAQFSIECSEGNRFEAELLGVDERLSLAVLKVDAMKNRSATLGSTLEYEELRLVSAAASGLRSDVVHPVKVRPMRHLPEEELQVCGHVNEVKEDLQNNCSGSLFWDPKGRFLGMISRTTGGTPRSGLRFAVLTAQKIRESVLEIAESRANLRAGWLGISGDPSSGLIRIGEVYDDSPAWRAGLLPRDVILEIDRERVTEWNQIVSMIQWQGPDREISMLIDRHGRERELRVQLGVKPVALMERRSFVIEVPDVWEGENAGQLKIRPEIKTQLADPGFDVLRMTPQLAEKLGTPKHGLVVWEVAAGSLARKEGFRSLDVLCEINGEQLNVPDDLNRLFNAARDGVVAIKYIRDGKIRVKRLRIQ